MLRRKLKNRVAAQNARDKKTRATGAQNINQEHRNYRNGFEHISTFRDPRTACSNRFQYVLIRRFRVY